MKRPTTPEERIARLDRRVAHLQERIMNPHRREQSKNWDRAEASALRWAITVCRLAGDDVIEKANRTSEHYQEIIHGLKRS